MDRERDTSTRAGQHRMCLPDVRRLTSAFAMSAIPRHLLLGLGPTLQSPDEAPRAAIETAWSSDVAISDRPRPIEIPSIFLCSSIHHRYVLPRRQKRPSNRSTKLQDKGSSTRR